jgi:predicted RNA binding protein with dsRBD fold (UPF0201 family)
VEQAVTNIFEGVSVEFKPSYKGSVLYATGEGRDALVKFRNLLSLDRIRSAARRVFRGGIHGDTVHFCLNKQVAYAGHVSFCEETAESPLGPIKVTIESGAPQQVIDWLAPRKT